MLKLMHPLIISFCLTFSLQASAFESVELESIGAAACAAGHQDALFAAELFWPPGEPSSDEKARHQPPDNVIDFHHLSGDLEIEPARGTIRGSVEHSFSPRASTVSTITIHAGKRLIVTGVKDPAGAALQFDREDEELRVHLASPLAPGAKTSFTVEYHGKPKDGMYFVKARVRGKRVPEVWTQGETTFNRDWIPLWDYPNEMFTTELKVRVPTDYTVIGNGALVKEEVQNKRRVFHYKQEQPHVAYLLSLVIGKFTIKRDVGPNNLPIWYVVYPEDTKYIDLCLGRTPFVIETMEALTSEPYPYVKYAQTVASEYPLGGMENVSATTEGRDYIVYNESAALTQDGMGLVAHEAAHQWFGDLLTCRDWAHIWLNEGFASYFESIVIEREQGMDQFYREMRGMAGWYFHEAKGYIRPIVKYDFKRPGAMFDGHTYSKGAWVLHMLRRELGDELFFKGIAHYVDTNKYKLVETPDLLKAMEEASGRNLHDFFHQWLYTAGHPVITVSVKDDKDAGLARVHVVQKSEHIFDFPLDVRVTYEDGVADNFTIQISEKDQVFFLNRRMEAKTIEIDPSLWQLKEMTFKAPVPMLRAQAEFGSTSIARTDAVIALKNHGDDLLNVATLDRVLNGQGQFWDTRVEAARSLAKIGNNEACAALRKGLEVDNARARRAAATSLGSCRGPQVAKALRQVIRKDPAVTVVGAALKSLGMMREHAHRKTLEAGLKRSSWIGVVSRGAAEGLAEIDDDWALPLLIKNANNTARHTRARVTSITALGQAVDRDPGLLEDVLEAAHDFLEDDNPFIVREALRLLAAHGDANDLAALESGIRKIPEKWYHKEIHGWRAKLKKRMAGLTDGGGADHSNQLEDLSETIKGLEERLKELEAKENAAAPNP
jgi:aminopeptidase N